MTTTAQLYRDFIRDHQFNHCWACGRTQDDRPDRWFADWWIDRAHLVNKPRVEDVRLVVLLCRLCHSRVSGARIVACPGHDWPRLRLEHLLWLKKVRDPENYDREFLKRFTVQRLPSARRPPLVYRLEYFTRHPE